MAIMKLPTCIFYMTFYFELIYFELCTSSSLYDILLFTMWIPHTIHITYQLIVTHIITRQVYYTMVEHKKNTYSM